MALNTVNGERGHVLVVAIVLAATMSVLLAMAIAPLRTQAQRTKEAELIYRGEHLAEGIRRFYFKFKRFPFDLEELVDSEPRMVRSLYPDPLSETGEWDLIYLTPKDQSTVRVLQRMIEPVAEEDGQPGQDESSVFAVKTRQITGIRPKSSETGLTVYQESQIYSDWEFTALPKAENILETLQHALKPPTSSGADLE